MTTLTVKIPDVLVNRLGAEAERNKTTKSEVVRRLLDQALKTAGQAAKGSCYQQASNLCGILKGLPRDLSINKRHLQGFGQ